MMSNYKEARDLLNQSIEIYKKIRPESHPDIDRNILNLGIINGELEEYETAEILLKQSLFNYENNYGKDHIETGKVLNHFGRMLILSKRYNEAEIKLENAFSILNNKSHPEAFRSMELLGYLYEEKSKENAVEKFFNQKTKIFKEKSNNFYNKSLRIALEHFNESSDNVRRLKAKLLVDS